MGTIKEITIHMGAILMYAAMLNLDHGLKAAKGRNRSHHD